MKVLQIITFNFIVLKSFAIHEVEFHSINCSTSPKNSVEFGVCECGGNKISTELNYVRSVGQHFVS
jgi:hypothetical protein